jgi:hypothetical protein
MFDPEVVGFSSACDESVENVKDTVDGTVPNGMYGDHASEFDALLSYCCVRLREPERANGCNVGEWRIHGGRVAAEAAIGETFYPSPTEVHSTIVE